MNVTFDQAMDLIQMLIIIIALILIHRSVPASELEKLFKSLRDAAARTATPVDDAAVTVGHLFTQILTGQLAGQQPAPAAPTTPQPVPVAVTGVVTASPASVSVPPINAAPTELNSDSVPG